jgi:hypothetical protein
VGFAMLRITLAFFLAWASDMAFRGQCGSARVKTGTTWDSVPIAYPSRTRHRLGGHWVTPHHAWQDIHVALVLQESEPVLVLTVP